MGKGTLLSLLIFAAQVAGYAQIPQKEIEINLPELYQEVDDAIDQSPKFVNAYEGKIDEMKKSLAGADSENQRLVILTQIAQMYESLNGDSALAYTMLCTKTARDLDMSDVEADYQAREAYLCTFLGSQTEALTLLQRIDRTKLTDEGVAIYFRAYLSSYETLSDNCKTPELREHFHQQHMLYLDSLLSTVTEESELYYFYREDQLIKQGKLDQALKMNDARLNQSAPGSHQDAIIAYSRYRIYQAKEDREKALYWLCRSALADIRNAVMDQMSLISLAKELDKDGDFERANRYISYTWESNRRYSPHMRSWQIAPLLSAIEHNFEAKLDKKSRQLTLLTTCSSVLAFLLIVVILYGRYKKKSLQSMVTVSE
jgi:hypothetical protein